MDNYKRALKNDIKESESYFVKSIIKTEQQKTLEKILKKKDTKLCYKIADIAGGGDFNLPFKQVIQ
jgi:hypothetical protein